MQISITIPKFTAEASLYEPSEDGQFVIDRNIDAYGQTVIAHCYQ